MNSLFLPPAVYEFAVEKSIDLIPNLMPGTRAHSVLYGKRSRSVKSKLPLSENLYFINKQNECLYSE